MEDSATKVMCPSAKGEGEEDSAKLKLHSDKTNNSLQRQDGCQWEQKMAGR